MPIILGDDIMHHMPLVELRSLSYSTVVTNFNIHGTATYTQMYIHTYVHLQTTKSADLSHNNSHTQSLLSMTRQNSPMKIRVFSSVLHTLHGNDVGVPGLKLMLP